MYMYVVGALHSCACIYITYMHRSVKPNSLFSAYSFIEYIFSRPEIKEGNITFLSNRICQDPLENCFGAQRQRGATSDNPSVSEFLKNTQALGVVNSFCSAPVRGNCRGAKDSGTANMGIENVPLPKRRRTAPK